MHSDDDLSKLEELLGAENSDDDSALKEDTNTLTTSEQPLKSSELFLQDIVSNEIDVLLAPKVKPTTAEAAGVSSIETSIVHSGDTDSSDDEERRNYTERKYNDYGVDIKRKLQHIEESKKNNGHFEFDRSKYSKTKEAAATSSTKPALKSILENKDIYTDPVFGMRLTNPLISGSALQERMQGRTAVTMARLKHHTATADLALDWAIAGAVVRKGAPCTSQKGKPFSIITLSDLKNDLKTASVFLFGNAYKQLWKTSVGTVIGILNPSVLDKKEGSVDEACLSIDNPDRVLILGKSKDYGICKSRKKNGDPCTSFVNLYQCQYCIYHVKQEYQKCSKRSELQSSTAGRGLNNLRNKVLGKSTVIYGGQEYSAIPAVKSKKMTAKDNNRLQSLSDYFKTSERDQLLINKAPSNMPAPVKKFATHVELQYSQRVKDLERLKLLKAGVSNCESVSDNVPGMASVSPSTKKIYSYLDTQLKSPTLSVPTLGFGLNKSSTIDLNIPFSKKQSDRAKMNAMQYIQKNGPLNKSNPHNLKGTNVGKKRALDKLNTSGDDENVDIEKKQAEKKPKTGILSDNFQKMMNASSAHAELIVNHDNEEVDKYFHKLETKEAMEEKMLNTFKVACKAVKCLKCKYTSFSASEKCKQEHHPLKLFDSFKRFFKCLQCGNRTVSLDIIPMHSCSNCKSSRWQKAAMIGEKKSVTLASTLSIRGEEETFIGSIQSGGNINLLVPDN